MSEQGLTHLNAAGEARMVDVSDKPVSVRTATAAGRVRLSAACVAALRAGGRDNGKPGLAAALDSARDQCFAAEFPHHQGSRADQDQHEREREHELDEQR